MTASIHVWLIAAYGRTIWQQASSAEGSRARRLDYLYFSGSLFDSVKLNSQSNLFPAVVMLIRYAESVLQQHFNGAEHQSGLEYQCRLPSWRVWTVEPVRCDPGIASVVWMASDQDSDCWEQGQWSFTRKSGFARSHRKRKPFNAALFD